MGSESAAPDAPDDGEVAVAPEPETVEPEAAEPEADENEDSES